MQQNKEEENYSKWLLKHEDMKQQAKQKEKLRLQEWVYKQLQQKKPIQVFEDDHYKQWRFIKQFRDIQDQSKFQGYKTFRHKPSHEMNKYFNQRQRKQIFEASARNQSLVDNGQIDNTLRSRSLRSQGPLNPKIQFRASFKDKDYPKPRMRFSNVTDKQRLQETRVTFDDKFRSVYSSFEMKKSKIGVPKVMRYADDGEDIWTEKSVRFQGSPLISPIHPNRGYHFELPMVNNEEDLTISKNLENDSKQVNKEEKEKFQKTYFKLAKTAEVKGCPGIKPLLLRTQYDRKKDLANINLNMSCQNYYKHPIS